MFSNLKNIKTSVFITLFVFEALYSFGQQGFSIKLYQNTDIFPRTCIILNPREVIKETRINFSRFSFAFNLSGKKCFHELELQFPEFEKPIEKLDFPLKYTFWKSDKQEETGSSFSFRYELGKFLGDKSKPVNFLLSAGVNPHYLNLEYASEFSNVYYTLIEYYGVILNATPRVLFKLNSHFSIDLNTPIRIYNFQVYKHRQDNPILPVSQQRYKETNHLFFEPVYTIRLGLMYSL